MSRTLPMMANLPGERLDPRAAAGYPRGKLGAPLAAEDARMSPGCSGQASSAVSCEREEATA